MSTRRKNRSRAAPPAVQAPTIELPLEGIPAALRSPLLEALKTIVRNFREGRWEPAELNGGKLCEVTISILRGVVDGKFPPTPSKPRNMLQACLDFEKADPARFTRSIRIQIPRVILGLYEIRNNRGVGHVGGDVDPNHMDAVFVLASAKWIVAELVRVFHDVDIPTATKAVDALVDRTLPIVWEVSGRKRVLRTDLSMLDATLVLLYGTLGPVSEQALCEWVGHSNPSVYRRNVLAAAHKRRLLEYDRDGHTAEISPLGTQYVEEHIPLELGA